MTYVYLMKGPKKVFMSNLKLVAILTFLFAGFIPSAYSQDPYSELHLTLTGNNIFGGNTLLKHWSPTAGFGLELSTPYYFGNLETGLRYMRYNELTYEESGFHSGFVFVGWNYTYFASEEKDLSIVPGVRLGNRFNVHDNDKIYGDEYRFNRMESEFSYELQFRIQYRINHRLGFYTSVGYNRTLYHISYAEWMGSAGFSVIFGTTDRLENFLK